MMILDVQRILVLVILKVVVANPHNNGQPHGHTHVHDDQRQQQQQQKGVVIGNPHNNGQPHGHTHVHDDQRQQQQQPQGVEKPQVLEELPGVHGQIVGDIEFPGEWNQTKEVAANEIIRGKEWQCYTRPNPGECRGAFPRYYFDTEIDQCSCFLWGGCEDDVNFEQNQSSSWLTLEDCIKSCNPVNKERGPSCKQYVTLEPSRFNYTTPSYATVPDLSHLNDNEFLESLTENNFS